MTIRCGTTLASSRDTASGSVASPHSRRCGPILGIAKQGSLVDERKEIGIADLLRSPELLDNISRRESPVSSTDFVTITYDVPGRSSLEAIERALRKCPRGLLRMKGVVRTEDGKLLHIQYAGSYTSVQEASGDASLFVVVVIGTARRHNEWGKWLDCVALELGWTRRSA